MAEVEVILLGKRHVLDTSEDPAAVHAAARLLEERLKSLAGEYAMISNERILVLAALNIAAELQAIRRDTKIDQIEESVYALAYRLQEALREEADQPVEPLDIGRAGK